jgi:ketosteroid isomerase-like protein
MRLRLILLCLLACGSGLALAAAPAEPRTPSETVDAFHKALRQGDGRGALEYLAGDVSIFEQGFAESSREDYAKAQLADAAEFARATERRVLRRESGQDTGSAWVLSMTLTTGQFGDRQLALEGAETMLLRRVGDAWKIAHIHWSAHPQAAAAPER